MFFQTIVPVSTVKSETSRPTPPKTRLRSLGEQLKQDLRSDKVLLAPVRGFMAVGWLRVCAEKIVDPNWHTVASLNAFLLEQLQTEHVAYPGYAILIEQLFLPHVLLLSWIVLIGQLLAGIGLLFGLLTRGALLGGMFMNANFLFAGVPNPSAFYLVIQAALLIGDSGAVFGIDRWRQSQTQEREDNSGWLIGLALGFAALALAALPQIKDFSPGGSGEDLAAITVVLATMAAVWSALGFVRRRLALSKKR
ncbi:MAG: DoxX family protein [Chloroflexales bacterium]|nr:DoxX family protein [Chloroflexales bacterium]